MNIKSVVCEWVVLTTTERPSREMLRVITKLATVLALSRYFN